MVKQLFTKFLLLNQVKTSNWLQYGIGLFFLKFASILHYAILNLAIKSYLYFSLESLPQNRWYKLFLIKDFKKKKLEFKFMQTAK